MKTQKKATGSILALAVVTAAMLFTVGSATAQPVDDFENSTVTVQVGNQIAVDISPATLSYTGILPGSQQFVTNNAEGFDAIEVENIGSQNITHVWLNASTPSSNPFGTGASTNYNAGNFIQIKPNGDIPGVSTDSNFTFVNRKEFNESNSLSYIFTEPNEDWRYGRFRTGDQEFFWAVNTTSGGACETTGTDNFRVGLTAHNESATGSNDFRTGSGEYTQYDLTAGSNVDGYATNVWINSSVQQTNRLYDVVVDCNAPGSGGTWAMRSRFNVNPAGEDLSAAGGAATYVLDGTSQPSDELQPGEHFQMNMSIQVPLGVAQGQVSNGFLRVLVNNN